MSVDLVLRNRQRLRKIDGQYLRRIALAVVADELKADPRFDSCRGEIGIHIVTARRMAGLNRRFLGHGGSTDVITLEYDPWDKGTPDGRWTFGEIFVCIDEAIAQAKRFRTTWQSEVARYVIHGILHLRGYDDLQPAARRRMKREETRLLKEIAHRFPLRNLALKVAGRRK